MDEEAASGDSERGGRYRGKPSLKETPTTMRRFYLLRHYDISGVSGTGVVAEGVEFSGGEVVLRWAGEARSLAFFDSVKAVEKVHCHKGATEVVWMDERWERTPDQVAAHTRGEKTDG